MKRKIIFGIIITILGIFLSGCVQQTKTLDTTPIPDTKTDTCEELAKKLDEKIIDTNNPPGRFIIKDFEGIVGGKLIKISEPWYFVPSDEEQNKVTYTMTFKGINKMGDLSLRTSSDLELPYKTGEFYKFDLKNKNQFSMQLSGAFMDPNLNALDHLQECD